MPIFALISIFDTIHVQNILKKMWKWKKYINLFSTATDFHLSFLVALTACQVWSEVCFYDLSTIYLVSKNTHRNEMLNTNRINKVLTRKMKLVIELTIFMTELTFLCRKLKKNIYILYIQNEHSFLNKFGKTN